MSYKLEIIQEDNKFKVTVNKDTVFYIKKLSDLESTMKNLKK